MAEKYITKIRTSEGDLQIDYKYLANKPVEDKETFDALMDSKQDASTAITKNNIVSYLSDKKVANADKLDGKDSTAFAEAGHSHTDYLKINSDTRPLILKEGVHYGTESQMNALTSVKKGQLFLKQI